MELPVADGYIKIAFLGEEEFSKCVAFKDIRSYQVRENLLFIAFSAPELTHASRMEYIPFTSLRQFTVFPNSDAYIEALEAYQEQCSHDWVGVPSSSPFNPDCRACNVCELVEPIMPLDPSEERTEM